jgi:hypothetical protein
LSVAVDVSPSAAPDTTGEPRDMRELYRRAQADLAKPTAEAHLRWIFWHARAVGRLEAAKVAQSEIHAWDRSVKAMVMATLSPSLKTAYATEGPHIDTLRLAETTLIEAAARVEVTTRIVDMLAPGMRVLHGGKT